MKREDKPGAPAPKPRPKTGPSTSKQLNELLDPNKGTAEKLRELDTLDVEFGEDFYKRMHDRIMARIVKTSVESPKSQPLTPVRRKAGSQELTSYLVSPGLTNDGVSRGLTVIR
ncbi:MAG: hypothetical protein ACK5P7_13760 [Bdellovibrio sp.]|jgi:hypothetical protein